MHGILTDLKDWGGEGQQSLWYLYWARKEPGAEAVVACCVVRGWLGPALSELVSLEAALLTLAPKIAASRFFLLVTTVSPP